jgi:hypothetical protein
MVVSLISVAIIILMPAATLSAASSFLLKKVERLTP